MATITTTPVQVPSNGRYNQFSNQDNPFYVNVGTDLYQVLFSAQGPSVPRAAGIFKRTANAVGTAWIEKDAANSPDQGNQAGIGCVSVNGTVITIAYVLFASTALRLCSFDTSTDTWGSPGDTTVLPDFIAVPSFHFCFVQRSDDTFVIVAAAQFYTYYLTNIAGVWSAAISVLPIGGIVCCGVIDATDTIHIAISTTLGQVDYRQLSSAYVLGSPTTISEMNLREGSFPYMIIWGGDTIVIGHLPLTFGTPFRVNMTMGTPLAAPVFTDSTVYFQNPAAGFSEKTLFPVPVEGASDGLLYCFFVDTNFSIGVNQIMQGAWDGSAWSVSIYYTPVANPPINGVAGTSSAQVIRSLQGVQLTQGWTVATAMTINDPANPPARVSSGEFLEPSVPAPPEPPPDVPGSISCQIVIGGPPGPGPAGPPRTLRYQIPQRRWFPHQYND